MTGGEQRMRSMSLRAAVAAAIAGATGAADVSIAQEGVSQGALEELVVTATRRAQRLQVVPVSIVAITSEILEMQGLARLEDVGKYIPNINVQGGGGGTSQPQFRVRGLPNVGVYV